MVRVVRLEHELIDTDCVACHKTRAVGGKDCVWMFVELDQPKPANQPAAGRGSSQQ